jgi:hypothetical protein
MRTVVPTALFAWPTRLVLESNLAADFVELTADRWKIGGEPPAASGAARNASADRQTDTVNAL